MREGRIVEKERQEQGRVIEMEEMVYDGVFFICVRKIYRLTNKTLQ